VVIFNNHIIDAYNYIQHLMYIGGTQKQKAFFECTQEIFWPLISAEINISLSKIQ
jgi:hypothetical protein